MLESNLLLRFTETAEFKELEKERDALTDAQRRGLHGINPNSNNSSSSGSSSSSSGSSNSSNSGSSSGFRDGSSGSSGFRDGSSKDCGGKLVGGVDEGQLQQQQPSLC